MASYTDIKKLRWYDIPCQVCEKPETNSWDKRISRALGYKHIVCEDCIAAEYAITVDELRATMQEHFGLLPCPGI